MLEISWLQDRLPLWKIIYIIAAITPLISSLHCIYNYSGGYQSGDTLHLILPRKRVDVFDKNPCQITTEMNMFGLAVGFRVNIEQNSVSTSNWPGRPDFEETWKNFICFVLVEKWTKWQRHFTDGAVWILLHEFVNQCCSKPNLPPDTDWWSLFLTFSWV